MIKKKKIQTQNKNTYKYQTNNHPKLILTVNYINSFLKDRRTTKHIHQKPLTNYKENNLPHTKQ